MEKRKGARALPPGAHRSRGPVPGLAGQLYEAIAAAPCINSHSHLPQEVDRLADVPDALGFLGQHYPAADLYAAGMPETDIELACGARFPESLGEGESGAAGSASSVSAAGDRLPLLSRWKLVAPYWPYVRLTGYARSILIGFRDLLGFDDLSEETVGPITHAVRDHSRPGYYSRILRERGNIRVSVAQMVDLVEVDRELFVPMPRLNRFSMIERRSQIDAIESDYGFRIRSLGDLMEGIRAVCERWSRAGVAGVKLSQSYFRRMDFHSRDRSDAEDVLKRILRGEQVAVSSGAGRALGDYLVFACCRIASELDLTVQFHLGLRAGVRRSLEGCSPAPMAELFAAFPEARFDLSHAGFPYLHESGVLAKAWRNVYLNMDWIQAVSPETSRRVLKEWLRMVPYNKLIAFGDDVTHVETAYGALVLARENVAVVLAELIAEGTLTESQALDVARAVFHDNPARLYGIERT